MAAEISFRHSATGSTMRATVCKEQTVGGKAQMWNGSAWEDLTVANWANYLITLTETPASSYKYIGTMPAVAAGWYYVDIYSGTAINSTLEATLFGYWDGTILSLGGGDVATIKQQTVTCAAGVTVRADIGAAGAPGAANGMLIAGENLATTFASLTCTGAFTISDGVVVTCSTDSKSAVKLTGGATAGKGLEIVGTGTGTAVTATGAVALSSTLVVSGATTFSGVVTATQANDIRGVKLGGIMATALTETGGGYLAGAFIKMFDVLTPVLTAASVNQTGDAYADTQILRRGLILLSTTVASVTSQTVLVLTAGAPDSSAYPPGSTVVIRDSVTAAEKCVGYVLTYVVSGGGTVFTLTLAADPAVYTIAAGDLVDILSTTPLIQDIDNEVDATYALVGNISITGSPSYTSSSSFTITAASITETNTYLMTDTTNAVYHSLTPVATSIDGYYTFQLGPDEVAVSVNFRGRLFSSPTAGRTAVIQAWDWTAGVPAFVTVETIAAVNADVATSDVTRAPILVGKYTGTGANLGVVRIRVYGTGLTTATPFRVDQMVLGVTVKTGGITNGSTVTLAGSNTNKNYEGENWILALGGQDISGSHFSGPRQVTGTSSGTTEVHFNQAVLGSGVAGVTCPPGRYSWCGFNTTVGQVFTGSAAGKYVFRDCYSYIAAGGATTPYFTFPDGALVMFRRYSGGAYIVLGGTSAMLTYECVTGGALTVEAAGGDIEIRGCPRSITITGITSTSTIRFVGITGPISLAGADGTVEIYGHCGVVTDSRTGTKTMTNTATSLVNVNAEADAAIETYKLDHLVAVADADDVVNDSIIAKLASKSATADWSGFVNTTDSLEANRDRGDAAWITATGFSTLTQTQVSGGAYDLTNATYIAALKAGLGTIPASGNWETTGAAAAALVAVDLDHLLKTATAAPPPTAGTYWAKILNWLRLALRSDAAIGVDASTELSEINQDMASGAGDFAGTTESLEAIMDWGTTNWTPTANTGTAATRLLTMLEADGLVYRFTTNALEQAPSGTGATTADLDARGITTSNKAQTGDSYAYLGTNLGALGANATEAGGTGDQLTAITWNAAWDAQVESEVTDALTAFTGDTSITLAKALEMLAAFMAGKVTATTAGGVTTYTYRKRDNTTVSFTALCTEADGLRTAAGSLS
jgi:hypothetical protein